MRKPNLKMADFCLDNGGRFTNEINEINETNQINEINDIDEVPPCHAL